MKKLILILIIGILTSCNKEIKPEKNIEIFPNKLKYSFQFAKAENQNGELTDFEFKIDTLKKIRNIKFYENLVFYKLNLTDSDSLYIGKRNDTIFTYHKNIDLVDVFLILNKSKHNYMGHIGDSFWVQLKNSTDSTFHFSLKKIKKSDFPDDVIFIIGKYPKKTISNIKTNLDGKIIDLKIKDNSLNN